MGVFDSPYPASWIPSFLGLYAVVSLVDLTHDPQGRPLSYSPKYLTPTTASLPGQGRIYLTCIHPATSLSSSRLPPLSSDSADQWLLHPIQLGEFRTVYIWLVVLARDFDDFVRRGGGAADGVG